MDTSFITDTHQKEIIDTAIRAVNNLELWNWLRDIHTESFMFSNDPNIMRVYREIEKVGYTGHSGASFGCTMRHIEFIAKNSIDAYRQRNLSNNNQTVVPPPPPTQRQISINPLYKSQ